MRKILALLLVSALLGCGADRHRPETYPVLVKRYEDVNGYAYLNCLMLSFRKHYTKEGIRSQRSTP